MRQQLEPSGGGEYPPAMRNRGVAPRGDFREGIVQKAEEQFRTYHAGVVERMYERQHQEGMSFYNRLLGI